MIRIFFFFLSFLLFRYIVYVNCGPPQIKLLGSATEQSNVLSCPQILFWWSSSWRGDGGKGYTSILYYLVVGNCELRVKGLSATSKLSCPQILFWWSSSWRGDGGKGYTSILYYLVVGHCELRVKGLSATSKTTPSPYFMFKQRLQPCLDN